MSLDDLSKDDDHSRTILHFDIDCFYAQAETLLDPTLSDKPLGIKQKNIVVTCNYLAREQGVKKCSFIAEAKKCCPQLVLVNGEDLSKYRKFSQQVFSLLQEYGKPFQCPVERLGLDENFMDISNLIEVRKKSEKSLIAQVSGNIYGQGDKEGCHCQYDCRSNLILGSIVADEIRKLILQTIGLTTSCGISYNKLLAKLAGAVNKPNQQTTLFSRSTLEFVTSLKNARVIPGIGSSTFKILESKGLSSVKDIQDSSMDFLNSFLEFSVAVKLKQLSLGIDPSPVKASGPALSVGLEDRFKVISTKEECLDKLQWLLGRLAKLLRDDGRQPQVLKVSIRDCIKDKGSFHKETRQCKISPSLFNGLKESDSFDSDSEKTLMNTLTGLVSKMIDFSQPFHLTLLGISVSDFVASAKNSILAYFGGEKATTSPKSDNNKTVVSHQNNKQTKETGIPTSSGTKRKVEEEVTQLPAGWDEEVFKSLPSELQQELLNSSSASLPSSQTIQVQVKKKAKNSILNYFGKS